MTWMLCLREGGPFRCRLGRIVPFGAATLPGSAGWQEHQLHSVMPFQYSGAFKRLCMLFANWVGVVLTGTTAEAENRA